MRTGISAIVVTITLVFFACSQDRKEGQDYIFRSNFTREKIEVDGLLEPAWQTAREILLKDNRSGEPVTEVSRQTRVRTCHDGEKLYISFTCNDPYIQANFTNRDDHLWLEDAVEVFIDCDVEPSTYVEIEVSPRNVIFDSYIVDPVNIDIPATKAFDLESIETAVSVNGTLNDTDDRDHSWTVEISISINELLGMPGLIVPDKTEWKINFYRIDRGPDVESSSYAWSPTGARFHKPSAFGSLRFVNAF